MSQRISDDDRIAEWGNQIDRITHEAYAIHHNRELFDRRYPVGAGVFLISPESRDLFSSYTVAEDVPSEVVHELTELGNWPAY